MSYNFIRCNNYNTAHNYLGDYRLMCHKYETIIKSPWTGVILIKANPSLQSNCSRRE